MNLLESIEQRVVLGDGALGTQLLLGERSWKDCLEFINVERPEEVHDLHRRYLDAGAEIIETNSFGANRVRLARHRLADRVNEINWQAAQIARQAAQGYPALVAGSVGPLGLSADEAQHHGIDRLEVYLEQIGALLDGGAQAIFLESFSDEKELLIALEAKQTLHHCPVVSMLSCDPSGFLPSGRPLEEALLELLEQGSDMMGVNCLSGPQATVRLLQRLPANLPLAAFPNAGSPAITEGKLSFDASPEYFAQAAEAMAAEGAKLIGGCCGIGPEHIKAAKARVRGLPVVHSKNRRLSVTVAESPAPPTDQPGEPSILDRYHQGKVVVVTELDPPKTLQLDRYMEAARAIHKAGSDAITLADNSLAILRVSNLAMGSLVQQKVGAIPLLHISCRDRNILGLQSYLMGMAAMGMRHVLPLTGDPAKVGDHPGATSVYDLNSIKLIALVKRMNEGFNANGKPLKANPSFVIGCTFNPNAKNIDTQVQRLERKAEAGAQYVMTQPIFDPALVDLTWDKTKHLNLPIFLGVWPLVSGRQAEFLHNEVPGVVVPEGIRESMAGLEGVDGRQAGLSLARDLIDKIMTRYRSIYLMTPFLSYELSVDLLQHIRAKPHP